MVTTLKLFFFPPAFGYDFQLRINSTNKVELLGPVSPRVGPQISSFHKNVSVFRRLKFGFPPWLGPQPSLFPVEWHQSNIRVSFAFPCTLDLRSGCFSLFFLFVSSFPFSVFHLAWAKSVFSFAHSQDFHVQMDAFCVFLPLFFTRLCFFSFKFFPACLQSERGL